MKTAIEAAQEKLTGQVLALPGVVGTAVGEWQAKPCIKVLVERKTPALLRDIPSRFEGYPVILDETGALHALPDAPKAG